MTAMIKVGQIVGADARPTAFTSSNIKWIVPIDPPVAPLPAVYPLAEMTMMDGVKIKVTDTVDAVMTMVNA